MGDLERLASTVDPSDLPAAIIWDTTYACPLLCVHCYSESGSGRRASKQLGPDELIKVADAFIAMGVQAVFLSGGEPLIVKGIQGVIERLNEARIPTHVFTSGWNLDAAKVAWLTPKLAATHISLDGATAEVHDSIRRRPGSFDRAMRALGALDDACRAARAAGKPPVLFGIECTILRGNFHQLQSFVTDIPNRFPEMTFVNVGAAVPSGPSSEPQFAESELLTETQLDVLRRGSIEAPPTASKALVSLNDNRALQMHPDDVARGTAMMDTAQVEPDGSVRAMAIYEGTVGNVLSEPAEVIWARAKQRWHDPFVVEHLRHARTRVAWAAATRAIDQRYGAKDDLVRIAKRRSLSSGTAGA